MVIESKTISIYINCLKVYISFTHFYQIFIKLYKKKDRYRGRWKILRPKLLGNIYILKSLPCGKYSWFSPNRLGECEKRCFGQVQRAVHFRFARSICILLAAARVSFSSLPWIFIQRATGADFRENRLERFI